jgi:hypothetical protein
MKFMGILMALVYVALGTFMIIYGPTSFNIPTRYAVPFDVLLIAYGIFRGYRTIHQYFKNDEL